MSHHVMEERIYLLGIYWNLFFLLPFTLRTLYSFLRAGSHSISALEVVFQRFLQKICMWNSSPSLLESVEPLENWKTKGYEKEQEQAPLQTKLIIKIGCFNMMVTSNTHIETHPLVCWKTNDSVECFFLSGSNQLWDLCMCLKVLIIWGTKHKMIEHDLKLGKHSPTP